MTSARVFTAIALTASLLGALESTAGAERSLVPANPNVTDATGDANYLSYTDAPLPVQPFPEVDLLDGWFTSTAKHVIAHIHILSDPRRKLLSTNYQMWANGADTRSTFSPLMSPCLVWAVTFPAQDYDFEARAVFQDWCTSELSQIVSFDLRELPDGTFIVSIAAPKSLSRALRTGQVLKNPYMRSRQYKHIPNTNHFWKTVDETEPGRDYRIR